MGAAWGRLCSVLCGNGFPPCVVPAGRALPQGKTLSQTCFTASGGSVMECFPSSFIFPHFPCPYSVVGKGNSGYYQHPRHPSGAVCQNAQGESIASFYPVFQWKGKAACSFGGSSGSLSWISVGRRQRGPHLLTSQLCKYRRAILALVPDLPGALCAPKSGTSRLW